MTMQTLRPDPLRVHEPFPLSDIQYAYWIGRQGLYELGNRPTHLYFELDGALEPERLDAAWDRMLQRHPMLRAEFLPSAEQRILPRPPGSYRIPVADLREVDAGERERRIAAVRDRMSNDAPPLEGWPHFDILLHLLPGGGTRLHFNIDMMITDAFSIRMLFGDWGRLYADPTAEIGPEINFRDYLLAERELLASEAAEASRAYWRERATALSPPPQLPRHAGASAGLLREARFNHRYGELSAVEMSALHDKAQDRGITGAALLAAAFGETLALWSSELRFTINATMARRFPLHPDVDRIFGDFTSTLLLELDATGRRTFVERAHQCNEQMWQDLDHLHVGGVEVLRQQSRARGRTVLNPIVFTCALRDLGDACDWAGTLVSHASETSQVTLDNRLFKYRGGLLISWDTVDGAYPPGLLDDMHAHYCERLRRLAVDDDAWTSTGRPFLPRTQAETRRAANATEGELPGGLLHSRVVQTAERQPERIAVIAEERTLTYGELLADSGALADELVAAGVAPAEPVAVVTRAGCERVIAPLAVLRAGGAYVPIDPDSPVDRFRVMFEDAGVRVAVTTAELDTSLTWPTGVRRLLVDRLPPPTGAADARPAPSPVDTAYVIYTSGSTGRPKGVALDHRGPVNTIVDITERFGIGPEDRVLALSNLSFDLSVYDIFGVLGAGGTLVYPQLSQRRDPRAWVEAVDRHRVTFWNTVPLLYSELVDAAAQCGSRLASLRLVLLSGDWIPLDLPGRSRALNVSAELVSLGGATEASIWSIYHPIGQVDPLWRSIPYGKPLRNQRFHVLDEHLEPCPDWVEGDLYIAGIGLAQGYWRDEERTRASFFAHPVTGERLYRTGDRGRYVPGGTIEFLGRKDSQVKIRGFRVELGDIESQLREHPDVRDCCVIVFPPPGEGARASARQSLVGYVLPGAGRSPAEEPLVAFLRGRVPDYMVPSRILFVDRIPKTANGKLDRRSLPDPMASLVDGRRARKPPVGPTQRAIAAIWAEILALPLEALDAHDRFFELGGNSLLLARLHRSLGKDFPQLEIPLVQLFEHQTIDALAALIDGTRPQAEMDVASIRQRADGKRRLLRRLQGNEDTT